MIATKLPSYLIRNHDNVVNIFDTELKRLQTDYVDNYLMHMLRDLKSLESSERIGH
jgi:predicted aldo/keto reductase-like oxidoreductase